MPQHAAFQAAKYSGYLAVDSNCVYAMDWAHFLGSTKIKVYHFNFFLIFKIITQEIKNELENMSVYYLEPQYFYIVNINGKIIML